MTWDPDPDLCPVKFRQKKLPPIVGTWIERNLIALAKDIEAGKYDGDLPPRKDTA